MRHQDDKVLEYPASAEPRKLNHGSRFMIYQFGNYFLDTETYRLCCGDEECSVEPQVFDLIVFLIENRTRVVGRDELLDKLWNGRVVSDSAINARLKQARKAVGDDGKSQTVIKTIHRRGYQFVADIVENKVAVVDPSSASDQVSVATQRPSIAVLKFINLSSNPDQQYFSDGIAQNIGGRLSRIRSLKVLAGHTIEVDGNACTDLAKELNAGYLLTGSVQREKDRVRVNVELVDGASGQIHWSERFDRHGEGVMDIQDEIAKAITGSLWSYHGIIREAEFEKMSCKLSRDFNAFDYILKGIHLKEQYTREKNLEARGYFKKAFELDPTSAEALGWCAWSYVIDIIFGWSPDSDKSLQSAIEVAKRAISIDANSEMGRWGLGQAYLQNNDFTRGFAEYRRAMEINPSNPDLMVTLGNELACYGEIDEGIDLILQGLEINIKPPEWYYWHLAIAYFCAQRHQDVVSNMEKMSQQNKHTLSYIIPSYVLLGRIDEAKLRYKELLQIEPEFRIEEINETHDYHSPEIKSLLIKGLKLASSEQPGSARMHLV